MTWIEGAISGPRTVRVAERPTASAPFAAPVAIDAPDVRIPHWVTPVASLVGGQALVAWIQGAAHTTAHDRAALAMRSGDGPWQAPIVRGVHGPAHVYEVELLARAAGRPPILAMTTSHGFHLGQATATVRDDRTLAPNRPVPTGGDAGLLPWLAQGGRHAWLATERVLGSSSHPRHQALLFRSG